MQEQLATPRQMADSRVGRLRQRIIDAPQQICVERARYLTRSMQANWDLDPLTRMSLATQEILNNISVIIRDEELIVGCRTSKRKGAPLFPENKVRWLATDVENFDRRMVQRALIDESEKKELLEKIIPFWEGKTVEDRFESILPEEIAADVDKYVFTFMLEITYGIGHFTMNLARVLDVGLAGIIADANQRLQALDAEARDGETGLFYRAVIRSLEAVVGFARRHADRATQMAAEAETPARKAELEEIARVCRRVPEHPASSFHEAVQSAYFIHLVTQIESGGNSVSLGRIDQILHPFYQRDREAGRITPNEARELLSLLFLKVGEIWNVLEEAYIPGGEGTEGKTTQNVTLGGVDHDGRDATGEISFIALDAYAAIRTVQPNMSLRFHEKTPELFLMRAMAYAKDGVLLHFFNDAAVIQTLTTAGHSPADANDYAIVGCVEPNAQGKTFGSTFAAQFNGCKCLEFALTNGVDNIFGFPAGIETGTPDQFSTFEDLWQAYDRQVRHFIGQLVGGMACLDRSIAELVPSPLASAFIDGPLEKGRDLTRGGAIYNSTGVQLMGFSNIVDSLFAVKTAVFDQKRFTLVALGDWLADDWMDVPEEQAFLRNRIDKYGNDKDGVDALAAEVAQHFCDALKPHRNFRGGAFWPGIFSVGFHISMGAFTGATPDGRSAGEILGNGVTPSNGVAACGPTAIMNSVAKLPLDRISNGMNLNMRFDGRKIKNRHLMHLVQAYFDKGGMQVQFNMVDSDTLRRAQEDPQSHRDLIVRISGYSGIFISLSDIAQEEIIARAQYDLN